MEDEVLAKVVASQPDKHIGEITDLEELKSIKIVEIDSNSSDIIYSVKGIEYLTRLHRLIIRSGDLE